MKRRGIDIGCMGQASMEDLVEISIQKVRNLVNHIGIEFSPVYSVLGSIISQEFVSYFEKSKIPALNWLIYDMNEGCAEVLQLQDLKVTL